jgi:hypothetical protein
MSEVLVLFLAACGTALATGLGAVPVFLLGPRAAALAPALLGFSVGVVSPRLRACLFRRPRKVLPPR